MLKHVFFCSGVHVETDCKAGTLKSYQLELWGPYKWPNWGYFTLFIGAKTSSITGRSPESCMDNLCQE